MVASSNNGAGIGRLFLRDDDVGEWTPALAAFIRTFSSCNLPVSYQVIPAFLTDDCARRLKDVWQAQPGMFEFGQHGLEHAMVIGGKRLSWEFGRERSLDEQERAIAQGKSILQDKLGDAFSGRLFTPPRHRFNRDTLCALERQGFTVISAAAYADFPRRAFYRCARALGIGTLANRGITHHPGKRPEARLTETSISVAVDDGSPVNRTVDEIMAALEQAQCFRDPVGLMFHHQAWAGPEGERFLAELAERLSGMHGVTFMLPGES